MAETLLAVPDPKATPGGYIRLATKVVAASEVNYGTPALRAIHDTVGVRNIGMFLKFANYTSVTVKLQRSYDGTNYVDIPSGSLDTSLTHVVVQPVAPFVQVSIGATLSAGADSLEVWLYEEYGPPMS